jgi:hypothetical protein
METKPKWAGAVPTNRHKSIPIDFGAISGCWHNEPKLSNCMCFLFFADPSETQHAVSPRAERAEHDMCALIERILSQMKPLGGTQEYETALDLV